MMDGFVYDVEVYPNYYGVGFMDLATGDITHYSSLRNNIDELTDFWNGCKDQKRLFGFNNFHYDDYIIWLIVDGGERDYMEIYKASQERITGGDNTRARVYSHTRDTRSILGDKIGGLKELGVKLDHQRLQELPYPFDQALTIQQMREVEDYNINDLEITAKLVRLLWTQIIARETIGQQYNVDVRSNRDAEVGEKVLARKLFGDGKPNWTKRRYWKITGNDLIPQEIMFKDNKLKEMLSEVKDLEITLRKVWDKDTKKWEWKSEGSVSLRVEFKDKVYSIGLGGLHSVDGPAIYASSDDHEIIDVDVQSYYPAIVLTRELCPEHLDKEAFLASYRELIEERIKAKLAGNASLSYGLKIAINSIYGKFKSKNSFLCDPVCAYSVTLTGQMIMMMLMELLAEQEGVEVISANTDGLLLYSRRDKREDIELCIRGIEEIFSVKFEYADYDIYARKSISDYVAIDKRGKIKGKGAYAYDKNNMMAKATNRVVVQAVQQYFLKSADVENTIKSNKEILDFIDYFKCDKGYHLEQDGQVIGTLARWYYSLGDNNGGNGKSIHKFKDKPEKMAAGEPITLVPDLPNTFPSDINYDYYIGAASKLISGIEDPRITPKTTTVDLKDLTKEQRELFKANHADLSYCETRMSQIDLAAMRKWYDEAGRSQHSYMYKIASSMWRRGRGRLTRGDLYELALRVDEGTGYFKKNDIKVRDLKKMVEGIARNNSPFPRELTLRDHAEMAVNNCKHLVADVTKILVHVSPSNSKLVLAGTLRKFLAGGTIGSLAHSVAKRAAANGHRLTIDELENILLQCVELRNIPKGGEMGETGKQEEETSIETPANNIASSDTKVVEKSSISGKGIDIQKYDTKYKPRWVRE